jgi:hypothetical protein
MVFPDLTGLSFSALILGYEEASAGARRSVLILATHGRTAPDAPVSDLADRGPHRPDDEIAMGTLRTAREISIRVPEELAVTGWDDIPAARHLAPTLTTVRKPMAELGTQAALLFAVQVDNRRTDPRHEVLATELVGRSNCGCVHPT